MDTYYRKILNLYPLILVALQNYKTLNFALENQFSHIAPPSLLVSSATGLIHYSVVNVFAGQSSVFIV